MICYHSNRKPMQYPNVQRSQGAQESFRKWAWEQSSFSTTPCAPRAVRQAQPGTAPAVSCAGAGRPQAPPQDGHMPTGTEDGTLFLSSAGSCLACAHRRQPASRPAPALMLFKHHVSFTRCARGPWFSDLREMRRTQPAR